MTLEGLRPGDLIRVDKRGDRFYAVFSARLPSGDVEFVPLERNNSWRRATAREVVGVWRRSKATPLPASVSSIEAAA